MKLGRLVAVVFFLLSITNVSCRLTLQDSSQAHLSSAPESPLMLPRHRVVITGLGVVNGVGIGIEEFWTNLVEGKNVAEILEDLPPSLNCKVACIVKDEQFNPKDYFRNAKDVHRNDRFTHFAMAASKMAMEDAKLNISEIDPNRFGVVVGSGIGGMQWIENQHANYLRNPQKVSPLTVPAMIGNIASGNIAIEVDARGPNFAVVTACATGSHSIGEAYRIIQRGDADLMLTGGAEAVADGFTMNAFGKLTALAKGYNEDPKRASRPFDAKRSGFVMGEGGGILLLESEVHALRRNARIYGEIVGYGATCDAHHITAPRSDAEGIARAMELAIEESGLPKSAIGYINAHGTSTPLNDKFETLGFKKVFGKQAKDLLISSSKSMTGHCLGAAGGIEACVAVKALTSGIAPPTINYEHPDPQCDLFYCPNVKVEKPGGFEAVMSTSLGFGGQNAALLIKKYNRK